MGRKIIVGALSALLTIFLFWESVFPQKIEAKEIFLPDIVQTKTVVTDNIQIDGIYRSMVGPTDSEQVQITDQARGELIWITGAKVEVVNEKDKALSNKYLCHSNLSLANPDQHNKMMRHTHIAPGLVKFLDLNQGQPDIEFPRGFAMPFSSNESIRFHAMALNNQPIEKTFDLRFKASLKYVYDHDLEQPMKVLRQAGIEVFVLAQQPNCEYLNKNAQCGVFHADESGRSWNSHWLVPSGRHAYRFSLNGRMFIPFDTTAHFIAMHVHPYAESMELVDITTNETVFKGQAQHYPNNQDIERLESYSSEEGTPLYRDHEYEVITVYNNVTDSDIDAMAILYIYFWDKNFQKNKIKIAADYN